MNEGNWLTGLQQAAWLEWLQSLRKRQKQNEDHSLLINLAFRVLSPPNSMAGAYPFQNIASAAFPMAKANGFRQWRQAGR